jgi:hypothetical protein
MARWILNPITIVAFEALLFTSCGAEYHLRRAIAKDPTIVKPTAVRFDTIVVTNERKLTDTIVMNDVDTITIENDRVRVRLVRSYDTLRVEGTCLPDTIRINVVRQIPQVVQRRSFFARREFGTWLGLVVAIFGIAFAVFGYRRRWY